MNRLSTDHWPQRTEPCQTEQTLCQTVVQTIGHTRVNAFGQTEPTFGQTVVQTIGRTFLAISLNSQEFRFLSNRTKHHSLRGDVGI